MASFQTQYRDHVHVYSHPGSKEHTLYGSSYDDRGRLVLKETGKENLYDYIQSFAESTDIHVILSKFVNGDRSVLERAQTTFADVTDFPKTYAELLNTVNEGETFFNSLPVDVRAKFGHSFGEFMAGMQDGTTFDLLGWTRAPEETPPAPDLPDAVLETKEAIESEPQH